MFRPAGVGNPAHSGERRVKIPPEANDTEKHLITRTNAFIHSFDILFLLCPRTADVKERHPDEELGRAGHGFEEPALHRDQG